MGRHSRHHSRDIGDYSPSDDPYASDPWGSHQPPRTSYDPDSARYRRRPEPSYHDDRWGPTTRDSPRESRRGRGREPRESRGVSEMMPGRRPYDAAASPESHHGRSSRRGRSEAAGTGRPSYDYDDPYGPPRRRETVREGGGGRDRDRDRDHDRDRDRDRSARYPPRTSDTRRSRYPAFNPASHPEDEDDFLPPPRARTQPLPNHRHSQSQPRGRPRNRSPGPGGPIPGPDPYHPSHQAPHHPSSTSSASRSHPNGPLPRSQSMPADPSNTSGTKSKAQKAVNYAAVGAAARVAFQAGAQAAYKLRNDPSPWMGEKGVRVATAALGAGLVDSFVNGRGSKMKKGGMRHQAIRQAAEMGIRNLVVQPVVAQAGKGMSQRRGSQRR